MVHKCSEERLTLAQGFFGALALGNIDRRAHNLNNLSIGFKTGMAYAMDVFDCSIRQHDSVFDFGTSFLVLMLRRPELVKVFRMYSLKRLLPRRQSLLRIESENPEVLL